ncbi:hypothetical protein HY480_01530 [Candidatus Uhrbacteria bacterium]|nr:hypothetical protein [Candidatus Uhrbacteria bacterium]
MNTHGNQTPLGVDPTPVTTSLGAAIVAAASDSGNSGSGEGAAPAGESKEKKPRRTTKAPRRTKSVATTDVAAPTPTVTPTNESDIPAPPPGLMSPEQLRALVEEARVEQERFRTIRIETDQIDARIVAFRKEYREVLNGEPTPLRQQVDDQLRLLEDRKVGLLQTLWDSAPAAALVVYMQDDVRLRGEDGLRTAVETALREGFIRILSRRAQGEAHRNRDANVVELRNSDGDFCAYAAADPDNASHRYIVSMLRHARHQCVQRRRIEDRAALDILMNRTVQAAIGLDAAAVLPSDAIRRIFDPTLPQFVAPTQPPSSRQALYDGTWGFGLRIEGLFAAHPKSGEDVKWSGTLLLAVQAVQSASGTSWKRLVVLRAVGQISAIIPEQQTFLLPSTDGSPIPIQPGGTLQAPSRSVRLLVEYIRKTVHPRKTDRNGAPLSDVAWGDQRFKGELRLLGLLDRERGEKVEPCYIEETRARLERGDREDEVRPADRRQRGTSRAGTRGSGRSTRPSGATVSPPAPSPLGTEARVADAAETLTAALDAATAATQPAPTGTEATPPTGDAPPTETPTK